MPLLLINEKQYFMQKFSLFILFAVCFSLVLTSCKVTQNITSAKPLAAANDSTKNKPIPKIKKYTEVITKDAVSDAGLFTAHKVADKYYWEIPDSLLGRDMLWITRYAAIPEGLGGGYVNAGSSVNEQMVSFVKLDNKILLKNRSFNNTAADSLPIFISVEANNYQPTLFAFDIAAFNKDSATTVIEVTKFFTSDIKAISGITPGMRKDYKVTKLDDTRSFISSIKSFPLNVEVRQDFTYDAAEPPSNAASGTISVLMNQSLVLLPKVPMQPRINDDRVGFFQVKQIDYGSEAYKSDEKSYIRRWQLVPKDIAAYNRGELVEPVKQIVYYLDPATPAKLRPYIKAGVEAWQAVFEKAGFKNAIIAKDPPTAAEDPDYNPEDVRYSSIRYVASTTRNAVGPSVSDPRSGEIIASDIIWYHNHLRSYRNRYMLETGAANPSARTLNTPMSDLGEMMKYVITHEVGHALGLPHNMKASSAYPTDSLRSGTFTQKNGIAASIMDYARYNYVAQPGDKNIRFIRQLGPYDYYVINWGYRYLSQAKTAEQETKTLNKWILEKANDPIYRFGSGAAYDPDSQTEGIGADVIKASTYGMENLKKVVPQLPKWTSTQTDDYDDLAEVYDELLGVWSRYIGHVATNIGGIHEDRMKPEQKGFVFTPVSASEQRASMQWMLTNAFSSPQWLHDAEISRNIKPAGYVESIRSLQMRQLYSLLTADRLQRLMENTVSGVNYTALDMMQQLQKGLFSEVYEGKNIDIYRRNLQKAYLERLNGLVNEEASKAAGVKQSDIISIARGQLTELLSQLKIASGKNVDELTRYHLKDAMVRVGEILEYRKR